jgi:hypothetical protein
MGGANNPMRFKDDGTAEELRAVIRAGSRFLHEAEVLDLRFSKRLRCNSEWDRLSHGPA